MFNKTTKFIVLLAAAASLLFIITACDNNGDTTVPAPSTKTAAAFDSLDSVFDVSAKTPADVDYYYDSEAPTLYESVPGYALSDFLTLAAVNALVDPAETTLDYRKLFCYDVVASDGYSFLTRNSALDLDSMLTGEYLYDVSDASGRITVDGELVDCRTYFPSTDIAKGYDIKNPEDISLYRAIKVSTSGADSINVLTDSFVTSSLTWVKISSTESSNTNDVVAAADLLYDFFTASSGDKTTATYLVKCADYDATDAYTYEELTYAQLQAAYFVIGTKTIAADSEYEDQLIVMNTTAADGTTPANDDSALRLKMPVEIAVSW